MKKFKSEWIAELLDKTDLEKLIGEYVPLQNKGGRLWACCPFHHEKTPSFTVNPEKGFYKCFGCGKSGNAISFIEEMEHLTFREACVFLAERNGMELPVLENDNGSSINKQDREKIYAINREAAAFFHNTMMQPSGKKVLDYFKKERGLKDNIIRAFGLGAVCDSWTSLTDYLKGKGYTPEEISRAGLCGIKDGRAYDFFRNRAMFPIIDAFGNVIGFGGRRMNPDEDRKYLNSSDTPVFYKKKNLYNINFVRKMKDLKFVILAEGYMDVIALASFGFANAVATLGTALTPEQARLVKRYSRLVYISYDGDAPGQNATLKAVDILNAVGVEPRVVVIPGGQDPDEFLREHGSAAYKKLIESSVGRIEYKFMTAKNKYDTSTDDGMEKYVKAAVEILKAETDPITIEKYCRLLAKETGYTEEAIKKGVGFTESPEISDDIFPKKAISDTGKRFVSEDYVMALLVRNPEGINLLCSEFGLTSGSFSCTEYRVIFNVLKECADEGTSVSGAELMMRLHDESNEVKMRATELLETEPGKIAPGDRKDSFMLDCINDIRRRQLETEKAELLERRKTAGDEEKELMLRRINEIIKILNKK